MRSTVSRSWFALIAVAGLAWTGGASAQVFSADYELARRQQSAGTVSPAANLLNLGSVQFSPALQADTEYSGVGLSLAAGRNWFAQVSVGQSVQPYAGLDGMGSSDAMRIGGGYRWGDGQSLSLQLTGARGPDRLGLSVSYGWPHYYVRLSYDTGITPVPQDRFRFSAGVRF